MYKPFLALFLWEEEDEGPYEVHTSRLAQAHAPLPCASGKKEVMMLVASLWWNVLVLVLLETRLGSFLAVFAPLSEYRF